MAMDFDSLRLQPGDRLLSTHMEMIADGLNREVSGPGVMHDASGTVIVPPPQATRIRIVKVEKDGGVGGDKDNDCTWTYTLTSLADVELATAVTPERARYAKTTYLEGGAGGRSEYGLASFIDGDWVLFEAYGEKETPSTC